LNQPTSQIRKKGSVKLYQTKGNYVMIARYTDKGGLTVQDIIRLRPARLMATEADNFKGAIQKNLANGSLMSYNENKAWISFKNIDLTGLKALKANIISPKLVGNIEVRVGSPSGQLIAKIPVNGTGSQINTSKIIETNGINNLYFVYDEQSGGVDIWKRLDLVWIEFE
jgi:cytochrome c